MGRFIVEKDFVVDGYRCVIIGGALGHRCGYIEIPVGHKLHSKDYSDIDELIDVHGGWTYSEYNGEAYPYPVESDINSWWIGFDCAHYCDGKDLELIKQLNNSEYFEHCINMNRLFPDKAPVRTKEYVENQLREAVEQIKSLN